MHSPHQVLSAIAALEKASIPLRKPNFQLIYSSAVHGLRNLEAGGAGDRNLQTAGGRGWLWSGRALNPLCDVGHTLQVPSLHVKLESSDLPLGQK